MTVPPESDRNFATDPAHYIELDGEIPLNYRQELPVQRPSTAFSAPPPLSREEAEAVLATDEQSHTPQALDAVYLSPQVLRFSSWHLIPLIISLLIIFLLFPQFLLILRGALLEMLLLLRVLLLPLLALGSAVLLLFLWYGRNP